MYSQRRPQPIESSLETMPFQAAGNIPPGDAVEQGIFPEPPRPAQQKRKTGSPDWVTWLLALAAFAAVVGLVPFGMWVYTALLAALP
jgi:hypothetical protein